MTNYGSLARGGGWIAAVATWIGDEAERLGIDLRGKLTHGETRPWSTVWWIETDIGRLWFKENCQGNRHEATVHAVLAEISPGLVDAPIAIEPVTGWSLTRDGGRTLMDASVGGNRGVEITSIARLLDDFAQVQRATVGHGSALIAAGLPIIEPREAPRLARICLEAMAAFSAADPRHLTPDEHRRLVAALPDIERSAHALTDGRVPLALDQTDLFPRNVFVPRSDGAPYRFFDFAEAIWSHPFGSLVMFVWELLHRWQVETPDDVVDCRDRRIQAVFDGYLGAWTDYAGLEELRVLCAHALRIAPLWRASVWLRVLDDVPEAVTDHGGTPKAWITDLARPVLL
jgi:hypothetical protein